MKNKTIKTVAALLMILVIQLGAALQVYAKSEVEYDGNAKKFVFLPSNKDLFDDFKGVMPGDVINQDITLKNNSKDNVKIYMKAESTENDNFLSQMKIKVLSKGAQISSGNADQTTGLNNWVLLDTLSAGASIDLDVELTVPIEMKNAFADQTGKIIWRFKVEVNDDSSSGGESSNNNNNNSGGNNNSNGSNNSGNNTNKPGNSAKTGEDITGVIIAGALLAISAIILVVFIIKKKTSKSS